MKGRCPRSDRRTGLIATSISTSSEWAGWHSNPRLRLFRAPLYRLSYRPEQCLRSLPTPEKRGKAKRNKKAQSSRDAGPGGPTRGLGRASEAQGHRIRAREQAVRRLALTSTTANFGPSGTHCNLAFVEPRPAVGSPSSRCPRRVVTVVDAAPRADVRGPGHFFRALFPRPSPYLCIRT